MKCHKDTIRLRRTQNEMPQKAIGFLCDLLCVLVSSWRDSFTIAGYYLCLVVCGLVILFYGCSETSVTVKDPPPSLACPDSVIIRTGEATFYTFADGTGNCGFDATPADLMIGAMNEVDYDNSNICGSCVSLTGPNGQINIRIVDRCPGCPLGGIDLSPYAFSFIADTSRGRVPITWHLIPCDISTPVQYHFKEGSNQWWTAVQVRNHRYPIAKFEYMTNAGTFKEVNRVQYNYFVEPGGMGPGSYTFRITDIYGHVLTDYGIPHTENGTVAGAGQFPVCSNN